MKRISDAMEYACEMGARYTFAMETVAQELYSFCGLNTLLDSGISRLSDTIIGLQSAQNELLSDTLRLMVVPTQIFVDKESNALKELSKNFQKTTQIHESCAARYSKKVSKQQQNDTLEEELAKSRTDLRISSLEYVSKLNEIEVMGKLNFLVSVTGLIDAHFKHLTNEQDTLSGAITYKEVLDQYLKKCKSVLEGELQKSLNHRVAHRSKYDQQSKATIQGYLFCAKKVKRGKAEGWERRFFAIDYGYLIQYKSSGDKVVKKRWNLLVASVKPRFDLERSFTFELTVMTTSADGKSMVPENLLFQAESEDKLRQWMETFQNAIMQSLSATKSKQESRMKIPHNVREQLATKNSRCVDCGKRDPEWAAINMGIMMCIKCSGIHRAIGVPISVVRSIQLDDWEKYAIKLMTELSNSKVNEILEENLPQLTQYTKLSPDSTTEQRDEFIKAKYVNKVFVPKEVDVDVVNHQLITACESDNVVQVLKLIFQGANVTAIDNNKTPLHVAVKHKQPLVTQLLLSNGAESMIDHQIEQQTPLHIAAENGDVDCITILLACRADVTIKNKDGLTAEEIAVKSADPTLDISRCFKRATEAYTSSFDVSLSEDQRLERMNSRDKIRSPHEPERTPSLRERLRRDSGSLIRIRDSREKARSPREIVTPNKTPSQTKLTDTSCNTDTPLDRRPSSPEVRRNVEALHPIPDTRKRDFHNRSTSLRAKTLRRSASESEVNDNLDNLDNSKLIFVAEEHVSVDDADEAHSDEDD
eukprot:TRINITY_DN1472_c0_g1_i4.p1 TRINITY_DN1472_c0_g1~~TRINITY_DN1472_c0_g1_i4.p1  ORF type:complete len:806 (-),score=153.72 TRINITY_DN1472_c0_g1_i4:245-2524(-)